MQAVSSILFLSFFMLLRGCAQTAPTATLKYQATGNAPEALAVYEAWFGGAPKHISIGYSTRDPKLLKSQMSKAKGMGISAFVVDWYGDREPFIDQSYAAMQTVAAKQKFKVAMMYDEADVQEGATDLVIADLTFFHDTYLAPTSPGRQAYLTFHGRPVIFVFPHGSRTDWARVRIAVDKWEMPPLLVQENSPGPHPDAFDGFYPWVNPGPQGWAADGSRWGGDYLTDFYQTMVTKHPDKMIVGGAWPRFDDTRASWGLNRHISARCGETYKDTMNLWRKVVPGGQIIPFMLIQTWNDYEEGSEIEPGLPVCGSQAAPSATK